MRNCCSASAGPIVTSRTWAKAPALLQSQGGLDRNLVERIEAHLESFRRHAGAVGFDAHAHVVVNDALDTDHDRLQEPLRDESRAAILATRARATRDSLQCRHDIRSAHRRRHFGAPPRPLPIGSSWIAVSRSRIRRPVAQRTSAATFPARGTHTWMTISRSIRAQPRVAIRCPIRSGSRQRLAAGESAEDHTVVAYDEASGAIAARLWWLLRWLGHERCAVLDGGFAAWQDAGRPVEQQPPSVVPQRYAARRPRSDEVVATDALAARQAAGDVLVDARAAPRYRGEQEPIDPKAGHVPGAAESPVLGQPDIGGTVPAAGRAAPRAAQPVGRPRPEPSRRHVRLGRYRLPPAARHGGGGLTRRAPVRRLMERVDSLAGAADQDRSGTVAAFLRQPRRDRLARAARRGKETPPILQLLKV